MKNPDWSITKHEDGWWSRVYENGRCEKMSGPFKSAKKARKASEAK